MITDHANIADDNFDKNITIENLVYLKPEHKIEENVEAGEINKINIGSESFKDRNEKNVLKNRDNSISDTVENAVKFGLDKVEELLTVKEPMWFKMGELLIRINIHITIIKSYWII